MQAVWREETGCKEAKMSWVFLVFPMQRKVLIFTDFDTWRETADFLIAQINQDSPSFTDNFQD